jgi:hypothetical protein
MPVVISKAAKALLVPSSYEVMAQWPTAPAYGDKAVIPYTLANTLILRHWGYKVPSPITKLYDWGADAPFKIQIDTCVMLTENPRSYVLNDMGTGKTKAALWAWDFLKKEGLANNLLVVAPLSTLHFVWAAEVLRVGR